jgi:hypothetical protein
MQSVGSSKTFLSQSTCNNGSRNYWCGFLLAISHGNRVGQAHNLDGFAQRFASWGIPYPYFNATLSA